MLHPRPRPLAPRWLYPLVLLVALALLPVAPRVAYAAWPPAVLASIDTTQGSNEPAIDYDSQGFAHVVWFGGVTNDAWAIYYSNNRNNRQWSPPRLISTGGRSDERKPKIAVGPDDTVHVVWERRKDGAEIYYNAGAAFGANWGAPQNVSNQSAQSYEPNIAVDASGTPTAVWIDRRFDRENDVTVASSLIGGRWSAVAKISSTDDRSPVIATTGSGANAQVHIVWQGRPFGSNTTLDYELYYSTGRAGGQYTAPRKLTDDNVWALDPAMTSNGSNELYVTWDAQVDGEHHPSLIRSIDNGVTWTPPRDLDPTATAGLFPEIDFGNTADGVRVHIVWQDTRGQNRPNNAYYLSYNPANNSFGNEIEQVSQLNRESARPAVGANPRTSSYGVAWQSQPAGGRRGIYVAEQVGAGGLPAPTPGVPQPTPPPPQGGPSATLAVAEGGETVQVTFNNVSGAPTEMRLAFDRAPNDNDQWEPFQASFARNVPANENCSRLVAAQLRNAAGTVSSVVVGRFVYDTSIQTIVNIQNPSYAGDEDRFTSPVARDISSNGASHGHIFYTRKPTFQLEVMDAGECSDLTTIAVEPFTNVISATGRGYVNVLPLPGGLDEGPREVRVRVRDSRANERTFTSTLTLDRTPPSVVSGEAQVGGVTGEAPSALVSLTLSNVSVNDNLYPGGYWGVWVANTLDPSLPDDAPALDWRPVVVPNPGTNVTLSRWNVLTGLGRPITDSLAGQSIQVRVRFLDGAGNPSSEPSLKATVRLAADYNKPSIYFPLLRR
jgi:hypothetical protein